MKSFLAAILLAWTALSAHAAEPPEAIKVGSLYAASGAYSSISLTAHRALQLWVETKNADGGVYVKAFDRKIPVKLIDYDDQSSTATAATLYNQLITQDKVDILVADSGSVLTSVGLPIAREHKQLLIDQTGTAQGFFTPDNPYIVLTSAPSSDSWAGTFGHFLDDVGVKLGIKRVSLLYSTNDFTGAMATTMRQMIKANPALQLVYDQGTPTSTSNYTVLLNNIAAGDPDCVIELGYPPNDIAFLRNLEDAGTQFKMVFTIYAGDEFELLARDVGAAGMKDTTTYVTAAFVDFPVNFGPTREQYEQAWAKRYAGAHLEFGVNALAGYNTGLVLERALGEATSLDQLELRRAIMSLSGSLTTFMGPFKLTEQGKQVGILQPVGQVKQQQAGKLALLPVFPEEYAKTQPVYPRP